MNVNEKESQQMEVGVVSLPGEECLLTDTGTGKDLETDCSEGPETQNVENASSIQTDIQAGSENIKDEIEETNKADKALTSPKVKVEEDIISIDDDDDSSSENDEDSSEEISDNSSEIDFENDMASGDDGYEEVKKRENITVKDTPEKMQKSSDIGIPTIDFSLLQLKDMKSIVVPKGTTFTQMGNYMHEVEYDRSIMIESLEGITTFNLGTILFKKNGEPLGEICDIIGNVRKPYYSLNFKTMEEIREKQLVPGEPICFIPNNEEFTSIVRFDEVNTYGTDASGVGDREASEEEFSDDEKEKQYIKSKKQRVPQTSWPAEKKKVKAKRKLNPQRASVLNQNILNQPPHGTYLPSPVTAFPLPNYPPIPPGYPQIPPSYPPINPNVPPPLSSYYGAPPQPYPSYSYGVPPPQLLPNAHQWPPQQVNPGHQWPPTNPQQWPPHPPNLPYPSHQNPGGYYR